MTRSYTAAPNDSRYIPLTQQRSCCVPTSIQMIMYRNTIPLIPAEELGYHLGLTVKPELKHLFYNVRYSKTPPSEAGYGTQIFNPEYDPNKMFRHFNIPLHFRIKLAHEIENSHELIALLKEVERKDSDALLCFNHGVIEGEFEPHSGHVAVFDRVIDEKIRLVDASPSQPKWREVDSSVLFEAIQKHGNENSGGIWYFEKINNN
ncbi:hypothetical protein KC573_00420 [candidate division WWE3 bacterium]|uniref:Peptidase C39-like domain-containing protein n=1 Tax=candidate division WWE3 bacterium TaxID=2053526 RepID=A0A955RVX1_UNCKA|nr:hypothetical protein [candidate division WWE3 bacterium]